MEYTLTIFIFYLLFCYLLYIDDGLEIHVIQLVINILEKCPVINLQNKSDLLSMLSFQMEPA